MRRASYDDLVRHAAQSGRSYTAVAREIGRTVQSVSHRAKVLGCAPRSARHSAEIKEFVRAHYLRPGWTAARIAEHISTHFGRPMTRPAVIGLAGRMRGE